MKKLFVILVAILGVLAGCDNSPVEQTVNLGDQELPSFFEIDADHDNNVTPEEYNAWLAAHVK
jgi:hypothetical protein